MPDAVSPAMQEVLDRIVQKVELDLDNKLQEAIARIIEKIERDRAAREAMKYIICRRNGGSFAECMGYYGVTPPGPGDPFFDELLNHVGIAEKRRLLAATKDLLEQDVRRTDGMLAKLERQN